MSLIVLKHLLEKLYPLSEMNRLLKELSKILQEKENMKKELKAVKKDKSISKTDKGYLVERIEETKKEIGALCKAIEEEEQKSKTPEEKLNMEKLKEEIQKLKRAQQDKKAMQ